MVTALGIDVRRAFTLVFAIGGAAAALAGVLAGVSFGSVSPGQGTSLLIFGFIVVVIGGMGSITGIRRGRGRGRSGAAVRQLLLAGARRHLRGRAARDRVCWSDRKGWRACPGGWRHDQIEAGAAAGRSAGVRGAAVLRGQTFPELFDGPLNSPGTLQLLAICLVFGGLATGYDLMFGRTGLLSFGHALYFAAGAYSTAILVNRTGWPLWVAAVVAIAAGAMLAVLLGAVALRTNGIAFAMVTLAFAQVGAIAVARNPGPPHRRGRGPPAGRRPAAGRARRCGQYREPVLDRARLRRNRRDRGAPHRRVAVRAGTGRRPRRRPTRRRHRFEPVPFPPVRIRHVGDPGRDGRCGVRTARRRRVTSCRFLGSHARRCWSWWCSAGLAPAGVRCSAVRCSRSCDNRLTALGSSDAVAGLPGVLSRPLSQPLFILGSVFILAVYFFPDGLSGFRGRIGTIGRTLGRRRQSSPASGVVTSVPADPPHAEAGVGRS